MSYFKKHSCRLQFAKESKSNHLQRQVTFIYRYIKKKCQLV
jgi:hypothetical protein